MEPKELMVLKPGPLNCQFFLVKSYESPTSLCTGLAESPHFASIKMPSIVGQSSFCESEISRVSPRPKTATDKHHIHAPCSETHRRVTQLLQGAVQ